ncbi:MAG TPA: DUF5615 family PIN-like protein [Verrucomicrobiae bacterium]|nr:DUF5615 family PIN-like protein [Verrucomicrobiae bacterium]
MKILLDECTPKPLKNIFSKHVVLTAQQMGWAGMKNGALLNAAEAADFEIIVTCDKNMFHQQQVKGRRLAVVELPTNRLPDLLLISREILAVIDTAKIGYYYRIPTQP